MSLISSLRSVNFPLMPKGVEHVGINVHPGQRENTVNFPLMPKGVEHRKSRFIKWQLSGEFSIDAERR